MDTVIGLGAAGCNIADEFTKYSQYKIYKIDCNLEGLKQDGIYDMPWQDSAEGYEEKCPDMTNFFKGLNGDVLFVIGGAGNISGAALSILQYIKHCNINILYIRPELESISVTKVRQEWVVFNVLQEYARSGVFERVYLVSNSKVEENLGNVPVIGYYDKLNNMVVSTFHMINVYNHIESVVDTFYKPLVGRRISTIGFYDTENNENKLFYSLDNIGEMRYYYAINKKKLETDGDILKKIREQVKGETETSYGIFPTSYDQDYIYMVGHTSEIQQQKSEKNT